MPPPRLRAVVLAAGHGTRLRPLTAELPKPLLPILGRPLIALTLERLAAVGVEATAINLHHRAEAIPAALGDRFAGMPLHYSREEPILGTLGALHPLREFLAPADLVLLVNGDSLCRWPFAELIERQLETGALATLLLSAAADVRPFARGLVAVDAGGRVLDLPVPRPSVATAEEAGGASPVAYRVFAGAHVFAPALAAAAPAAFSDIVRELYRPRLARGARIESVSTQEAWHDLGTPARYLDAVLDALRRVGGGGDAGSGGARWIGPGATVAIDATLEEVVMEGGARAEAGVGLRSTLLMGRARVGAGSRLARVLVGPGVELPPATELAECLVTPREWGSVERSRRLGDLVLTPIGEP